MCRDEIVTLLCVLLMMEEVASYELSIPIYQTTWCQIPEGDTHHSLVLDVEQILIYILYIYF
jgi:hypothetical protein